MNFPLHDSENIFSLCRTKILINLHIWNDFADIVSLLRKCSIQYDFNFLNQFCSARNSQPFTDDCSGSWPHSHVSSVTLFLKQSHLAAFGGNSICHVHYCMVFKAKKHCYLTIFVVVLGVIKNWVLYYTLMKVHNSSMYCILCNHCV